MTPEERKLFKERMKQLKSYRELNPGKGYWDWKIRSFENGGEVDTFERKTRKDIARESLVDDRLDYERMFENLNLYLKDFARKWYTERAKTPKYYDQIGGDKLNAVLSSIDRATWKTPTEAMRDNLISKGYTPTDTQIQQLLDVLKSKGTMGFANPNMYSYTSMKPFNTWHEGIGHIVGDNNPSILKANPNVYMQSNDTTYLDYINKANEKHAQTWDFRGNNQTMKDDEGNYYIDPNRLLTPEDVLEMIDKGAKIPEQWKGTVSPEEISLMHNTFADTGNKYDDNGIQYVAEGGEITKKPNTRTRTDYDRTNPYTGKPLATGIAGSVFDLEDAANLTPIGDAISINDTYQAIKQKDWEGAGLAALTMIPFVPMTVKQFRSKYKGITPKKKVNKYNSKLMDDLIQRLLTELGVYKQSRINYYNKALEEQRKIRDTWVENEDAFRRAVAFDKKYGTNYKQAYSDELRRQNIDVGMKVLPPLVDGSFDPSIPDFIFLNNLNVPTGYLAPGVVNHEMGHAIDYRAGVLDNYGNTKIKLFDPKKFKSKTELQKIYPDKKLLDNILNYRLKDSEIKSHMNLFRTYLRENNMLDPSGKETLEPFKKKLFDSNFEGLKLIFNSYKDPKDFVKDFNLIPITKVKNKKTLA